MNLPVRSFTNVSWRVRLLSLLLVMALLAVALPQPALAVTCATRYTVKAGDTLTSIAAQYNVTVTELANANSLVSPFTIFVGQVLCIPATATTTTTGTSTTTTNPTLTAKRQGNKLVIEASGLSKQTSYYLRVKSASRTATTWYKLGTFRTSKTGTKTIIEASPRALRTTPVITVCVKHAMNDKVFCQNLVVYP